MSVVHTNADVASKSGCSGRALSALPLLLSIAGCWALVPGIAPRTCTALISLSLFAMVKWHTIAHHEAANGVRVSSVERFA